MMPVITELVLGAGDQLMNAGCQHGSKPVVGSSNRTISGSMTSARANPARFFMPPLSSAGNLPPILPKPTCSKPFIDLFLDVAFRAAGFFAQGKGDVVEDGHRVEQRRALKQHAELAAHLRRVLFARSLVISTPSIKTSPASGSKSAFKCFSKTVLPQPLVPTMVVILPRGELQIHPLRTCWPRKLLCKLVTWIMALQHDGSQKIVPDQNQAQTTSTTDSVVAWLTPVAMGGA